MNSISTFNEYQEARKIEKALFKKYFLTSIPALIFLGFSVISNIETDMSPVIFWLSVLSIIPGVVLGLMSMKLWKKIMVADKNCCDYLNSHQNNKVTYWTRDSRLKKIEAFVSQNLAS